jgi:hypothetical protein
MKYNLEQFVKFSAFILTSADGNIDEEEKKVLFNHPMIIDKINIDIEPLLKKYEDEIIEKKEKLFFEQFKPILKDVKNDFKYEFKILLKDIMLADGVIEDNEFKIFDSITQILEFDEEKYLDEIFGHKELKEIIIPSKYKVLKITENEIINSLSKQYRINHKKGKNPKIEVVEIGTKFEFDKWDHGVLEGSSHNLTFEIDYRKFKDEKYGTYFMVLTAANTDGGYYNLNNLKLKFGNKNQNIIIVKTSNHQKQHDRSSIGSGEYKTTVTIYVESIQFAITPYEFKKIIELDNNLELKADTHTSNLEMSNNLKNSLISLFNETTNSNFKSFEIYKDTKSFKSKLKKYNERISLNIYKKIEKDIKSLDIKNLNLEKVKDSFLDNKLWGVIKNDEKYIELFERFVGKKYLIMGIIFSVMSFPLTSIIGWWEIGVLLLIIITFIVLDSNENQKKFKSHKILNKYKLEEFEKLIKNSKPKILK